MPLSSVFDNVLSALWSVSVGVGAGVMPSSLSSAKVTCFCPFCRLYGPL